MNTRREFFKSAALIGVLGSAGLAGDVCSAEAFPLVIANDRRYWVSVAEKLARPVLSNLAKRQLKSRMPVEEQRGAKRAAYTHLEAFGRLLCGMSPWLELQGLSGGELQLQKEFVDLTKSSLDAATDPQSPDFMNFTSGGQPLVDAAFLAQGILRAPGVLWKSLDTNLQKQLIAALKSSRQIKTPDHNNWVMFAAMVEAALLIMGESTVEERLEGCVRKMLGWYVGDGAYGDGEFFHFDYYNSYVIQPMLLDVLEVLKNHDERFARPYEVVLERARRFADIQERLIAPDGTFTVFGRSIAYRFGAFQLLSLISLRRQLPSSIKPAQVRAALTAVIRQTMEPAGTFDAEGWLQIGLSGHQPALGENYISTGSLYLCSAGLLPLGLPPEEEFWSAPAERWTSQKIWNHDNLPADHAIKDVRQIEVPTLKRS